MSDSWKFFVLSRDKVPLRNCDACRESGPEHDRETCACLTCHAHYAGTDDPARLAEMNERYPGHPWAVRCGRASGIVVLDVEAEFLSTLDEWESWVNDDWRPPPTLTATSASGGLHLFYRSIRRVTSRNRVLPGVDVKAEGGYVLVPHPNTPERRWLNRQQPTLITGAFDLWLGAARGGRYAEGDGVSSHAAGYDFKQFALHRCPGGFRDEFFNDLIFRLRKQGLAFDVAASQVHMHWARVAQPPDAKFYMPWQHVEYKLHRVWRTVEPNEVPEWQRAWASAINERSQPNASGWPTGRRGRATVV